MNIDIPFAQAFDLHLKSAAILLLGAGLLLPLRKSSAANRHTVSAAIFAALLLLPFTNLISPLWSFALEEMPEPAVSVRLPLPERLESAPEQANPLVAVSASDLAVSSRMEIPWKVLALSVWLGGVLLLLARRGLIAIRLRALVRCSEVIKDERLLLMANDLVKRSGARAEVRESALCRVPIVAGIVRPVVLLPLEAQDWSDGLIASALRHELGHIRRRDCVTRLFADLVRAVYWVNPLVWFAARQMRLAQEQACDDLVLNSGATAEEYAGQLVEVVRSLSGDRFTARHALAMAQPSTLETRVLAIVDANRDRSPRSVRGTVAGFAFITTALAFCTAAQLRAADPEKPAVVAAASAEPDASNAPQLVIEAKFIEFSGKVEELPEILQEAVRLEKPGVATIVGGKVATDALKELSAVAGVDMLSMPRVVAFSKQLAKVEMVSEFRYATEWDKDAKSGAWKPKAFDTKNPGVTFEVTPVVNDDSTIALHMVPQVIEFEGFIDLDATPVNASSEPGTARPIAAGADGKGLPEGHRGEAVFNTWKMDKTVMVKSGDTVVLGGVEREEVQIVTDAVPVLGDLPLVGQLFKSSEEHRIPKRLIILVTARVVEPAEEPGSFEILSDTATFNEKTGNITASGNVEIKTADAVIRADAVQVTPKKAEAGSLITSVYKVPPGFLARLAPAGGASATAKELLMAQGIDFGPGTSVVYNNATGQLIARNTREQLELLSALVLEKANAEAGWILPKVEFRDSTLRECIGFLVAKSKELDPAGEGVNIVLKDVDKIGDAMITLSLSNVPITEVIRYVAALAGSEVVADEFSYVIQPAGNPAAEAAAKPAAMKKAEAIVLPKIEFQEATLSEAVIFLGEKAKELDADKQGVNLILEPAAGGLEPTLTLSLANVPLSEALRYVAQLAGCEIFADDNAITLRPMEK